MWIPPTGGHNGGSGTVGGGDLHLPPPEHGLTVHCDQDHYGPVSSGGAENGDKDTQAVTRTGRSGCGRDADNGLGGGTDGGGGGEIQDRYGDRLNRWGDNV